MLSPPELLFSHYTKCSSVKRHILIFLFFPSRGFLKVVHLFFIKGYCLSHSFNFLTIRFQTFAAIYLNIWGKTGRNVPVHQPIIFSFNFFFFFNHTLLCSAPAFSFLFHTVMKPRAGGGFLFFLMLYRLTQRATFHISIFIILKCANWNSASIKLTGSQSKQFTPNRCQILLFTYPLFDPRSITQLRCPGALGW